MWHRWAEGEPCCGAGRPRGEGFKKVVVVDSVKGYLEVKCDWVCAPYGDH